MELSGPIWVERFPTSTDVEDLEPEFRDCVRRFLDVLYDAGAEVTITATRRPRERAYLMHYAWNIARRRIMPSQVPAFEPVLPDAPRIDIDWLHVDRRGRPSHSRSCAAARKMMHGYDIVDLGVPPSLSSLHIDGLAIDMVIAWVGELAIETASGRRLTIQSKPRSGINAELMQVGAGYGVVHLAAAEADPPHWSVNGR